MDGHDRHAYTATELSALSAMQFGLGLVAARAGIAPAWALGLGLGFEFMRDRRDVTGRAAALRDLVFYVTGYGVGAATMYAGATPVYERIMENR